MRLPGSGSPEEDGIVSLLDELAAVKLAHERLVDFTAGKVEADQVAIGGKGCGDEPTKPAKTRGGMCSTTSRCSTTQCANTSETGYCRP
ncbi:hypothetical protein IWQ48_003211 [Labrenzia sp. EL_13]|nr:hypothetical protein [Labrenzia sp. EL_195]MBG6202068.1 hypothetical protein [Labrenzia sp. EL_13]